MKKQLLLFAFSVMFITLFATNHQPYSVKESNFKTISISFSINDLDVRQSGDYAVLTADGYTLSREVGKPALPLLIKMVEIPLCSDIVVNYNLRNADTVSLPMITPERQIMPAQPSYPKNYKGKPEFQKDNAVYSTDNYYALDPVRVEKTGVLRNINAATIYVAPVKYNPVTGKMIVYHDIDVEITFEDADVVATQEMTQLHGNRYFASSELTINTLPMTSKDNYSAPVKYLIVSHSMFKGQFDNFVDWKKRKGFLVEVAYTDDPAVGTTYNSIQSFIKSKYTNATPQEPAPTFVLFIGDVAQIPTKDIYGEHPTDLYYFDWTGNGIPDCFYGRFSAATEAHLAPQVEKTLMYEQMTMSDPSYLDHAILIAGEDDNGYAYTHGNTAMDYISSNYLNANNGYTTVDYYKYPHPSTATATIRNNICQGAGFINYTAHGWVGGWAGPEFSSSDVSSMTNEGKYGLMVGNCCESNKYDETSFGEVLLRANKKGAVGYIGGADYTYWYEDVYWSVGARDYISESTTSPTTFQYDGANLGALDRLFHTHNEPFEKWMTTFGGMIYAGNMAVQTSSTDAESKTYYWEIYNLIGDPSVMPWLTQPENMTLTADPISSDATSISVHTVPYAYVALTNNLELVAAAFADENGEVTLTFDPIEDFSKVEVAASAQNYKTAFCALTILGVNDADNQDKAYRLSPNPATTFIDVTAPEGQEIRIFDAGGRWLGTYVSDGATTRIDVSGFASGFYFVKADKTTMKFIKK